MVSTPAGPGESAAQVHPEPGSRYCNLFESMLRAQPNGRMDDPEFGSSMASYAESVEAVAELSGDDDAVVLWELAAIARRLAEDPSDPQTAQRLGAMTQQVGSIVLPTTQRCAIDSDG